MKVLCQRQSLLPLGLEMEESAGGKSACQAIVDINLSDEEPPSSSSQHLLSQFTSLPLHSFRVAATLTHQGPIAIHSLPLLLDDDKISVSSSPCCHADDPIAHQAENIHLSSEPRNTQLTIATTKQKF